MKKLLMMGCAGLALTFVTGCASSYPIGGLYTELTLPITATANGARSSKMGTASCTSVLGMVATGDASIETAKKNGGITKVHHIDWKARNILGLFGEYEIIVYGE